MKSEGVAFVSNIANRIPALLPLLQEHLSDQSNEILPHVLMADITRWILSRVHDHGIKDEVVQKFVSALEEAFHGGSNQIDELIAASFLENLPHAGQAGAEIRTLLGPRLRKQMDIIGF